MWSARWPAIWKRHVISPVFGPAMWSATTSLKLGRETTRSLPFGVEYMSSTSWSLPSPTSSRIAMK